MNFENNENNEIMSESGYINSRSDSGSDNDAFAPVTEESGDFPKEAGKETDSAGNRDSAPDMMKSYKSACLKFGFFLTVTLLMRIVAQGLAPAAVRLINSVTSSVDVKYALSLLYSALFLQVIPSFIAAAMLKYSLKNLAGGFHPPKNSKKAFANFPAVYGAGMTVNLITMALIQLVTHNGNINDSVNSLMLSPPSMTSAAVLFVMLVIVAPIFEEFIFRGAVMNLLKPYGSGIAVFVSAFCFAVFHPGKPYEQCRRTQHQPRHTDQPGGIRSQQSAFSGNGEKDRNFTDDIHDPMDNRGIHDIIASHHDPGTDHADRHANKHHHEHVAPGRAHVFRTIIKAQADQGQVRYSPKDAMQ